MRIMRKIKTLAILGGSLLLGADAAAQIELFGVNYSLDATATFNQQYRLISTLRAVDTAGVSFSSARYQILPIYQDVEPSTAAGRDFTLYE
jgi:hypothetical protein